MLSTALSRRDFLALGIATTVGGCLGTQNDRGIQRTTNSSEESITMSDNHRADRQTPSALHEPLGGLEQAEDNESFAEQHNLTVDDGTVRVVIELEPGHEPPEALIVSIEDRYGRRLRGYVRIAELSELAAHEAVRAVRPPEQAEPMDE